MHSPMVDEARSEVTRSWWLGSATGRWLLLTAMWLALAAVFTVQQVAGRTLDWRIAAVFGLLDWGPWIILSPLVLWLAGRVQVDGRNWRWSLPVHFVTALVLVTLIELGANAVMDSGAFPVPDMGGGGARRTAPGGDGGGRREDENRPQPPRFIRARFSLPIYFVLVAAAHAAAYHRRSLERERRALTAEARLAEARLMALQTQLQPHFLFNTLNAISSLVYTQPQAADEMICALSDLLRNVLAASERKQVSLKEELGFIDHYLAIQQIRFADRLEVRREIAPGLDDAIVPTLILQPLVENAVVHGIAPQSTRGVLIVRVRAEGKRLKLSVSDTGRGAGTLKTRADGGLEFKENVGLGNTRARLAALYGDDFHFTLAPAPEGGVCAQLDLPLRRVATA